MIGETWGHYRVLGLLGAGGMGEVYRAEDTTLDREVAVKVLPAEFTEDPERLARFEREAKLLATLNHPHIAQIHALEEVDGQKLLVMELVEGETLAEHIARGALSLEDSRKTALQIAQALEAAHERGIVHRDLKPANVKLTPDGDVKVLDFGLAKPVTDPASGDLTHSPTLTYSPTQAGMLLGTAAYMSPEQVRGEDVDKRSDIWSFGVVLWEMITGKRLFDGETPPEILAAVLRDPIDRYALPTDTHAIFGAIIGRCLDRDVRSRLRDIGEARVALDSLSSNCEILALVGSSGLLPAETATPTRSSSVPWLLASLATVAALVLGILWIRESKLGPLDLDVQAVEAVILPPDGTRLDRDGGIALSPDGRMIAFVVVGESARRELWIRPLDNRTSRVLDGTRGARYPFWSPDSRNLGFFSSGSLKRVAASGGPVETIAPAPNPRGGTWCANDQIVYSPDLNRGLAVVAAVGGVPTDLTQIDAERGENQHRLPFCMPSGDHVLLLAQTAEGGSREDESHIDVVSLETRERQEIIQANSSMAYSPTGHLFFWREGSLMAVLFDALTFELSGDSQQIIQEVAYTDNEYAIFSISQTGLLAYQMDDPVIAKSRLLTVDSTGAALKEPSLADIYKNVVVSHDGRKAAYEASDFSSLWIRDLVRGTTSRFTHQDGDHFSPVWSPDDEWLCFGTDRESVWQVFRRRASGLGSEEPLLESALNLRPLDWSPGGEYLIVEVLEPDADRHIGLFTFEDQSLEVLIDSPFLDMEGDISPDGEWLAYTSTETGRFEIYVVPFLGEGGKYQVSTDGGNFPEWDPQGEKLFYSNLEGDLIAVDVEFDDGLAIGDSKGLFNIRHSRSAGKPFNVLPGGESFFINQLGASNTPDHIILVQNWLEKLERPVPASRN